jgi:hypothetical protein
MVVHGDYSPNNAGPVMYLDLFDPVFLIALLWMLDRKRREESIGQVKSS